MTDEFVTKIVNGHPPVVRMDAQKKWGKIYETLSTMPVVNNPQNNTTEGWKGFEISNKKLAAGAASSVSGYCYQTIKCRNVGLRLQTTIQEGSGKAILWIRKIAIR